MAKPITPEDMVYGFTPAGDPQISPDGERIVFALTTMDQGAKKPEQHLWLMQRDGSGKRQLTRSGKANRQARWSPDGSAIAFVSDRVEPSGIFLLPMAGGEARQVLVHPGQIIDLAWSPDGRWLAFTSPFDPANPEGTKRSPGDVPPVRVTSRIDYKQDNRGYLGDARTQVYVVDVGTGEAKAVTSDLVDHNNPAWSPDGRSILVRVALENGMTTRLKLVTLDGAMAPVGERYLTWQKGVVSSFAWSPSGEEILFAGDPDNTWQTDWFLVDTAGGDPRRLTDDLQCLPDGGFPTITPPSQPAWLDAHRAVFHAFSRGASATFTIDTRDGTVSEIERELEMRAGFSADAACRWAAQGATSLDCFGEVAIVDLVEGRRTIVTGYSEPVLQVTPPARWERFDVVRGGFTTEAWLLLPRDFDPAKKYPLVIDIHGGPNGFYGYGLNGIQQCLATSGIPVVFANPRGSSSYGREFTVQVKNDWGGEDYRDLMAVVDRALERPYFDPARTGIYGYSYGGYMTAWTIAQNHRFRAAVCGAPCFDLEAMYGTSDISHRFGPLQWGGAPHEAREWYATHSPSQIAHNTRTPTLIIQGEADERCPVGQGEAMFVALKQAGCEVEFARYPGGSHLFMRTGPAEHREDVLRRVVQWFSDRLGGPA